VVARRTLDGGERGVDGWEGRHVSKWLQKPMTVEIDRSKVQAEPISFICFNLSKYALSCLWGWGWSGGIGGADAVEGVGVGECLLSG
jgi:hypothetical protein